MTPQDYYGWTRCFALFSDLDNDPVIAAFYELLKEPSPNTYARFAGLLYKAGTVNWTEYLSAQVLCHENGCTLLASHGKPIPAQMLTAAKTELYALSEMALLAPDFFDIYGYKAPWIVQDECDLYPLWLERLFEADKHGYGMFAKYRMFRYEDGRLVPIVHADPVRLSDLVGYETQKAALMNDFRALLEGLPASNVLLYGDAGTGKSASVKAAVNELADEGLRLVEIGKGELKGLPALLDRLSNEALKFVVFIDDLSFGSSDESFSALKAVLEGSAAARSVNTVICATSNRRHLVRETFADREGGEIHRNDSMQETVSLSERFGLRLYYEKPDKSLYLRIVHELAQKAGVDDAGLDLIAERYALGKAGRSARAARQLVELLAADNKEGI